MNVFSVHTYTIKISFTCRHSTLFYLTLPQLALSCVALPMRSLAGTGQSQESINASHVRADLLYKEAIMNVGQSYGTVYMGSPQSSSSSSSQAGSVSNHPGEEQRERKKERRSVGGKGDMRDQYLLFTQLTFCLSSSFSSISYHNDWLPSTLHYSISLQLPGLYMLHGVNTPNSSNSSSNSKLEVTDSPLQQRRRGNGDNPSTSSSSSSSSSSSGSNSIHILHDTIAIDVRNSYPSASYNSHTDFSVERNADNA